MLRVGSSELIYTCLCIIILQVIITVPLAVLKRDMIKFIPPLSSEKEKAIQRLGAGIVEKVHMPSLSTVTVYYISLSGCTEI